MSDLCDYFLYWTLRVIQETEDHEFSPEVYDRAVSVIGIAVPLGLYFLCLFLIALAALAMFKAIGGRRR